MHNLKLILDAESAELRKDGVKTPLARWPHRMLFEKLVAGLDKHARASKLKSTMLKLRVVARPGASKLSRAIARAVTKALGL